jgi:hypothetical protein
MILPQPSLPNYQQIGKDAADLIADMLAPWPDDRPQVEVILQRLDRLEETLQPELHQLDSKQEQLTVLIGQDLMVDFMILGKGLPNTLDWLQISLDQSPLEKPQIKAINANSFQLKLPIFTELRQHSLSLSTQLFGEEQRADARIKVRPDAN